MPLDAEPGMPPSIDSVGWTGDRRQHLFAVKTDGSGEPVQLTDGFSVAFGTWLEIADEDFRHAWQIWNAPEYADLAIEGYVANEIEPWNPFPHAMVRAVVRDVEQVPYLATSDDPLFARILGETLPHADVLTHYAKLLKSDPPLEN